MSEPETFSINVYEEDLNEETTLDLASRDLEAVPTLNNLSYVVVYLQNNQLRTLPEDFFPSLKSLMYLDLRDNRLTDIPKSVENHQALTHLLLQNNCLTSLPFELGTVSLKVLQLTGNPLMAPPREIINCGVAKILTYLYDNYIDNLPIPKSFKHANDDRHTPEELSFNSVINEIMEKSMKIELSEKCDSEEVEECYSKLKGKCPKLDKSRHKNLPPYYQSAKYVKPLYADPKGRKDEKIRQAYLKDLTIAKKKDLLATRERVLQERRNLEHLKKWRDTYRVGQFYNTKSNYRVKPENYPFGTNPECMSILTREDIEKELPDKYKKKLQKRSRPTVARKSAQDLHLAMKIKKLFENLEAIDKDRSQMTPRTEQKKLMNEIQQISEIKQKLMKLSFSNMNSVSEI